MVKFIITGFILYFLIASFCFIIFNTSIRRFDIFFISTSVFFALQDKGVLDKSFGYLTEDEIRQNEHDKTLDQVIAEIKERVMLAQLGLEKATSNHDIGFFTGTRETLKYLKSAIEKLKVKT